MEKERYVLSAGVLIVLLILVVCVQTSRLKSLVGQSSEAYLTSVKTVNNAKKNANNEQKIEESIVDESIEQDKTEYNVIDNYVLTSRYISKTYLSVLNNKLKNGQGYVSLSRIMYFYNANNALSFNEIYDDNLNPQTNKEELISNVCKKDKYNNLYVCAQEYVDGSDQVDLNQSKPFMYPLPMESSTFTSVFMEQRSYEKHAAWDIAAPTGTPIYAVCDGTINEASYGYNGGYGNEIIQTCLNNGATYEIRYAHLSKLNISQGTNAIKGTIIGYVGSTGSSTGSHLHFEVKSNGNKVDGLSLINFN